MPVYTEEPDYGQWEPRPIFEEACELRISRHCTGEAEYVWEDEPCCVFCLELAEEARERAEERERLARVRQ